MSSNEPWTIILFRNGARLDFPQSANSVIDQMARAGSLSLLCLQCRGGIVGLVSAPDIVAIAERAPDSDSTMSMLPRAEVAKNSADRVIEHQRDADGLIVSSVSREVRGR